MPPRRFDPGCSDRLDGPVRRCDRRAAAATFALRLGLGVRKAAGVDVIWRRPAIAPRRCVAAGAVELARADAGLGQAELRAVGGLEIAGDRRRDRAGLLYPVSSRKVGARP
jgi:hypothetical protein